MALISLVLMIPGVKTAVRQSLGVGLCLMSPLSRGQVRLSSKDPSEPPSIDPRYLTQESDWDALYSLFCSLRRAQSSEQGRKVLGFELQPGPAYGYCGSEARFRSWVRATALPYFHLCGTCRMGTRAADSVVDANLRVHGVKGLRVADASVAPRIPSAPIQAMVAMVGHRASSLIANGS